MRTIKIVLVSLAAAALSLLGATAAFASPGPGGNGQTGTGTGNNAFTYSSFNFPDSGAVICNETQHPKFDTVECQGPGVQLQAYEGQTLSVGWISDFLSGPHAGQTGVLTYTVAPDGLSYSGQVFYN
jgi:hypothetical protein